jgi:hypothetical protein
LVLRGTIIFATKEFLLNLHRDLIQPLFSSVCPTFVVPDRRLKLPYPVFSCSKLSRQFVGHFYGLLVVCLSSTSGSVKSAQNRLTGPEGP